MGGGGKGQVSVRGVVAEVRETRPLPGQTSHGTYEFACETEAETEADREK